LSSETGYTSIIAFSSQEQDGVYLRGTRFMLEQPEFSDLSRLRNLFYALEVERNQIHDLLLQYLNDRVKVLIGDDIGLNEISDCALMVSGSRDNDLSFSLGLLGPMRMNYKKASRCLYSVKEQLHDLVEELI
jgi:heat-inducible transcriptional repressor